MARLYLDENIGSRALARSLIDAGHSVVFSRDLGYSHAPDDFHLYIAAQRHEVLVTHDPDFTLIHGALYRFARDHGLGDIHAGILIGPRTTTAPFETARLIDAFFAAQLPIANALYKYQAIGSWVRFPVAFTFP